MSLQQNWTTFPSSDKPNADLVLRFEEIPEWTTALINAGFHFSGEHLPHIGKSALGKKTNLEILDLSVSEISALRNKVEERRLLDEE